MSKVMTVGVVIALAACAGAADAAAGSSVVQPGGTAAGEGYSYWMQQKDIAFFDSGGKSKVCGTLHGSAGAVAFLNGGGVGGKLTCDVPAGRPIYVDGVSNECSTFKGDHNGFGTSDSQLERCARDQFKKSHLSGTASVDGVAVKNYSKLIAAAAAVGVHMPKKNEFGLKPGSGRTADYGEGLLLQGLSAGVHTIHVTSSTPGGTQHVEYIVHVR